MLPTSGEVLRVTRAASVQFRKPLMFRVIRVLGGTTYDGWAWLEGYQLNSAGDAVERREIFVQLNGLQPAASRRDQATSVASRSALASPIRDRATSVASRRDRATVAP